MTSAGGNPHKQNSRLEQETAAEVATDVNNYNKSMKEEGSIFLEYGEIRRGPGQSRAVSLVCDAEI
jgi:hypothetical protein